MGQIIKQDSDFLPNGDKRPDYNGWKNRVTWNIVLWLQNEYILNCAAQGYASYPQPYRSLRRDLRDAFRYTLTKDQVSLWDSSLDLDALDDAIREWKGSAKNL